jgi:opacity protein-like surface antigen
MKLKALILAILLTLPFAQKLSAQSGEFEMRFNLGYGFHTGSQFIQSYEGSTVKNIPYSLGAGLNVDLGGTYMFGDHLGAGLDLSYLMGGPVKFTENANSVVINHTLMGNLFALTPMLVLSAHHEEINPYGRFGIVLGTASFTNTITETGSKAQSGTYIDTYSGGLATGLYAAFGLQFKLAENLKLNLEVFDRTMSYAPTLLTNTQAYDGEQKLTSTTFVDQVDGSTANHTELKTFYPYSSVGLKVGITLVLASGEHK